MYVFTSCYYVSKEFQILGILYFPEYTVVSSILIQIAGTISGCNLASKRLQINFLKLQINICVRVYQKLHRKFFASETSDIDPTEDSHRTYGPAIFGETLREVITIPDKKRFYRFEKTSNDRFGVLFKFREGLIVKERKARAHMFLDVATTHCRLFALEVTDKSLPPLAWSWTNRLSNCTHCLSDCLVTFVDNELNKQIKHCIISYVNLLLLSRKKKW